MQPVKFIQQLTGQPCSKVVNFKDYMVFDAASIHTCISFFCKDARSSEVIFFEATTDEKITSSDIESQLRPFSIQRADLKDDWIMADQPSTSIFQKLKHDSVLLGDIAIIAKGSESGKNDVFTVNVDTVNEYKLEKSIIRKCIKNSNIKKYFIDYRGQYLIYADNDFDPSIFKYSFEYLKNYKPQLLNRRGPLHQEYEWYRLHRPSIKEVFDADEKLIVPYRADRNCFAYDNEQYFNDGGDIRAIVINDGKVNISRVPHFHHRSKFFPCCDQCA